MTAAARAAAVLLCGLLVAVAGCDGDSRSEPVADPQDGGPTGPTATSSHAASTPSQAAVPADRLGTGSAALGAEEVIALGRLAGHGVLRDGTTLTVWADSRHSYDGDEPVRRAYRLESPSGRVSTGRLPDGDPGWTTRTSNVTTTAGGFLVTGSMPVFVRRDGSLRPTRPGRGGPLQDGDVLLPVEDQRSVHVVRPRSLTEFTRPTEGRNVAPLALSRGTLYGWLDPPADLSPTAGIHLGTLRDSGAWSTYRVGDYYQPKVAADGARAATWSCWEGGYGWGGDDSACAWKDFAVTTDAGATWTRLEPTERPFGQLDAAVAAGGVLYVDAWPRGYWRSADPSWTSFTRLDLPAGSELHAEDGFASAVTQHRRRVTIVRLGAAAPSPRRWTFDAPPPPRSVEPLVSYGSHLVVAGSGDGSVAVRSSGKHPVTRIVDEDGVVASGSWSAPIGLSSGFLELDRPDVAGSTYLEDDRTVPVTNGPRADLRSGDALFTYGRLSRWRSPPLPRNEELWAFRPADRMLHRIAMPPLHRWTRVAGVVDPRGRAWLVQARDLWHSDDAGKTWTKEELDDPSWPRGLEASGDRLLLRLRSPEGPVARVLTPGGRWRTVVLPDIVPLSADLWLLHDGRLLAGPVDGRFWRGTSAANRRFEALPAGPIQQVVTAGRLLYGVPIGPAWSWRAARPLRNDKDRVWLSEDGGSTWREVAR